MKLNIFSGRAVASMLVSFCFFLAILAACVKDPVLQDENVLTTGKQAFEVKQDIVTINYEVKYAGSQAAVYTNLKAFIAEYKTWFSTRTDKRVILKFQPGLFIVQSSGSPAPAGEIDFSDFNPGSTNTLVIQGTDSEGANATTLEFPNQGQTELVGVNCSNIEFRNIRFSRKSTPTVTQGTVVGVTAPSGGVPGTVTLQVPVGFPDPRTLVDPDACLGKYLKRYKPNGGTPDLDTDVSNVQVPFNTVAANGVTNQYVFTLKNGITAPYATTNLIGVKSKMGAPAYRFTNASYFLFHNVAWKGQARGLFQGDSHHVTLFGCKVRVLRTTDGFSENFCMSTPSGGPQLGNEHTGALSVPNCNGFSSAPPGGGRTHHMVVQNCIFESLGDDNIAFFRVDYGNILGNVLTNSFVRGININTCRNICLGTKNNDDSDAEISSCWDPILFQDSDDSDIIMNPDEVPGQTASQGCPYTP